MFCLASSLLNATAIAIIKDNFINEQNYYTDEVSSDSETIGYEPSMIYWAKEGDWKKMQELYLDGYDLNVRGLYGETPLIAAILELIEIPTQKQVRIMKLCKVITLLLQLGAEPRITDDDGFTAMDYALCAGAHPQLFTMLQKRADELNGLSY